jgi:diguanylate cyclase (GGDEF)-like protein
MGDELGHDQQTLMPAGHAGAAAADATHRTRLLLVVNVDSDANRFDAMLEEAAPAAFEVVRATTLAEATSYLASKTADCVVVDLGLPDAAGVEIIEVLAARSPAVALIGLTGRDDDELGVATIETGASDYLSKSALEGRLLVRSIRHAILRKRVETSLAEAQSIAGVGSWELDIGTGSTSWSRELYRLFGFPLDEKPSYEALLERCHADDKEVLLRALRTTMVEFTPFVVEHRVLLSGGEERWVRARGRMELDGAGAPLRLLGTAQDISEQRASEGVMLYQALHDPLSGLPNRLLLLDRLGQSVKRLARGASVIAVVYFDIDRFQVINDRLGRATGDELLVALAERLAGLARPAETLARIGGDEFVMVCEGLSGEAEAVRIADAIRVAASGPIAVTRGDLVVSLSAGIALASSPAADPDSVLRDAEAAMYLAKREGRARSAVFEQTMRTTAVGRFDTEIELRQSIVDGDLLVYYQPIVTLSDGRVVGHEALVRWAHPTRGLVFPDVFIPVAEETGLIVPLGAWVLREACRQAKRFQAFDPSYAKLTMSVNLSGAQLAQADLTELVASAVQDAGIRPEHLQLEMTESVLMSDAAATITVLTTLKSLGVRLGIDDFGTGYSSLAYLRRFPVDVIKIDRTFVNGLGKDLEDSAVVAAVISLADTLGLTTVAEGVETALQRDCLLSLGCVRAQGYLFARPVAASEAEAALVDAVEERRPPVHAMANRSI